MKKGFTLIEILVALVIISVLMSIGIIFYQQAITKSRDEKRKQDLNQVAQALELYYQVNSSYPGSPGEWRNSSMSDPWIGGLIPNFTESLPKDLRQSSGSSYFYHVNSTSGCPSLSNNQFYILMAILENKNDPDRLEVRDVLDCNGISITNTLTLPTYSQAYILTPP